MSIATLARDALDQLSDAGEQDITIVSRTATYDNNDDVSYSESSETVQGIVFVMGLEEVRDIGGQLEVGDLQVFLKHSVDIERGDVITHNSIDYRVDRIVPIDSIDGTVVYQEVFAKRDEY